MSSASTADHPARAPRPTAAAYARDVDPPMLAPRSAAAGASEDPYRWRGLGRPHGSAADAPPTRPSVAEDLYPWRGLRPTPAPYPARAAPPGGAPAAGPAVDPDAGPAVDPDAGPAAGPDAASIVVIGLGNPILGDDGVGWRVVDVVRARLHDPAGDVRVENAALGGLALMERLVGARRAILVDAMETGAVPDGTVTCMTLDDVGCRAADHLDSAHDMSLTAAIAAGRALGADLPADVRVVAVEARHVDTFSDDLSPDVAAAVPAAVDAVLRLLEA